MDALKGRNEVKREGLQELERRTVKVRKLAVGAEV